jgi:hypothetical protein
MFTLEYANNPVYSSPDNTSISLTIKWEEFGEEHNFAATLYDSEPHGVDLYNRAIAGEFGEIAPYVAPPPAATESLLQLSPELIAQLKQQLGL